MLLALGFKPLATAHRDRPNFYGIGRNALDDAANVQNVLVTHQDERDAGETGCMTMGNFENRELIIYWYEKNGPAKAIDRAKKCRAGRVDAALAELVRAQATSPRRSGEDATRDLREAALFDRRRLNQSLARLACRSAGR